MKYPYTKFTVYKQAVGEWHGNGKVVECEFGEIKIYYGVIQDIMPFTTDLISVLNEIRKNIYR